MNQIRGIRRGAVLTVGLLSALTMALPAQAGLGDLLDDVHDPLDDVPIIGDIVQPTVDVLEPLVDTVVDPTVGPLVDPIVDQVLVEEVLPPVQGTDPIQGTTPTVPLPGSAAQTGDDSRPLGASASSDIAKWGYPGGVVAPASAAGHVASTNDATEIESLRLALTLQTALIASDAPLIPVSDFGLDGLTNWLRTDLLRNLLALPVRLLDLLARALLTAGSGLIAPLSLLLALTAYLIKDRRWVGPHASQPSKPRDRHPSHEKPRQVGFRLLATR
jgi:hypothetical protein